jgi:plasmid stabilization system protein ParE
LIAYSFHPDAEAELADAAEYYEARRPGLGKAFAGEVTRTISLIREYPDAGSPVGPSRRRMLVSRFPYAIIYRRDRNSVVIVAVAHQSRRPGYWRGRR